MDDDEAMAAMRLVAAMRLMASMGGAMFGPGAQMSNFRIIHHGPGGESVTLGVDGSLSPYNGDTASRCGDEFDAFILKAPDKPFPYDPNNPAGRNVRDVWSGRRVCVANGVDGAWREGSVAILSQSNAGPFAPYTNWAMSIRFDDAAREGEESPFEDDVDEDVRDAEWFELHGCDVRRGGSFSDGRIPFEFISPSVPDADAVLAAD
jgi:hypothetical protein